MTTESNLTTIQIRGAREHNLKNISLDIPRDQLVVITGLSGSGKSSLAFDTIYAEGQRRYVECMSAYARQFLGIMKKPDVDLIEGLSPAISIEQKTVGHNPRSTVGTVTEIYDYLRLLYAKAGIQYCVHCNIPVMQQSPDQIVESVLIHAKAMPETAICYVYAPLVKGRKGHYRELFEQLRRQGYTRVRIDGDVQEISEGMQLRRYQTHVIDVVVDRLQVNEGQQRRLTESIETALAVGEGNVYIEFLRNNTSLQKLNYSTTLSCPQCGSSYSEPAPNSFSFNSPFGACTACEGLGETRNFDPALIIPDTSVSIADGGIAPLGKKRETWLWQIASAYCRETGINTSSPIADLSAEKLHLFLEGGDNIRVKVSYKQRSVFHRFIGLLPALRHQYEQTTSSASRKLIEQYFSSKPCSECHGARIRPENLFIRINDKNIYEVTALDIETAEAWFRDLTNHLSNRQRIIAGIIIKEIVSRLHFLNQVGLSYLTLSRSSRTLSGGESQRIRLASQIGSQLVGVTYVLDEPSIGLHQHDNMKLIQSLKELRDLGNTVIVVEHDKEMIVEADKVVDIGPGAGIHGGSVTAQFSMRPDAPPPQFSGKSLTYDYLSGKSSIPIPAIRRSNAGNELVLTGASGNNLKDITLRLPLGTFTCVTGMSGSGKSSLINSTLYPILAKHYHKAETNPLPYDSITGLEYLDKVIEIDQAPIGRTPRSNPATYTGLFTHIRDFFAVLPDAKVRGYKTGRFSFNVAGGRCEECEGSGLRRIEMSFLPDVYVNCETCNGKRYNAETLAVQYKGKSIADVLDMSVDEALDFFSSIPKIRHRLQTLYDVGLSYIRLGQQAPTLSGGEAQRVKLATELAKVGTGKTLYLLDEPTTGLHFDDIRVLLKLLDTLVDRGNTVLVIEHNLDVIAHADHIVDLGPHGGRHGGIIVASGTPEQIAAHPMSITGQYLRSMLTGA